VVTPQTAPLLHEQAVRDVRGRAAYALLRSAIFTGEATSGAPRDGFHT
jgi:hypothetical protein